MSLSVTDQELIFEFSKLIGNKCVRRTNIDNYDRQLRQELITQEVLKDLKDFKLQGLCAELLAKFIKTNLFSRQLLGHSTRMKYETIIYFKHAEEMDKYKRQGKKEEVKINVRPNKKEIEEEEISRIRNFLNPKRIQDTEQTKKMNPRTPYRPQFEKRGTSGYKLQEFYLNFCILPSVVKEDMMYSTAIKNKDIEMEFNRRRSYWARNVEVNGFKEKSPYQLIGFQAQPWAIWASEAKGSVSKGHKREFEELPQEIQDIYVQRVTRLKEEIGERTDEEIFTFPLKMLEKVRQFMEGKKKEEEDRKKKEEEERKASKRKVSVWDDDGDYKEESIEDYNKQFKSD